MNRAFAPALALSLLAHAGLALVVRLPGAHAERAERPPLDTVAVAFLDAPTPPPPPPVRPQAPAAPDAGDRAGAAMQGEGRPVRRAETERPAETRRPAAVERRAEAPPTAARVRPNTRPSTVPPVAPPRTRPAPTPAPDRVASRQPPGTERGTEAGIGTRDRPDGRDDGGGRPGLPSTREVDAGSPNGTADGSTSGAPGAGAGAARGSGAGVDVSGFGNRRLTARPLPANSEGTTVTLTAVIEVRPDGSVRFVRWSRRGNAALQRQAETALARWRFAALPGGVPQETQTGSVTFRFVAN